MLCAISANSSRSPPRPSEATSDALADVTDNLPRSENGKGTVARGLCIRCNIRKSSARARGSRENNRAADHISRRWQLNYVLPDLAAQGRHYSTTITTTLASTLHQPRNILHQFPVSSCGSGEKFSQPTQELAVCSRWNEAFDFRGNICSCESPPVLFHRPVTREELVHSAAM